jgi:hypothetical protein
MYYHVLLHHYGSTHCPAIVVALYLLLYIASLLLFRLLLSRCLVHTMATSRRDLELHKVMQAIACDAPHMTILNLSVCAMPNLDTSSDRYQCGNVMEQYCNLTPSELARISEACRSASKAASSLRSLVFVVSRATLQWQ